LLREGFEGSHDAARRYAARWTTERRKDAGDAAKKAIRAGPFVVWGGCICENQKNC
jgi:hypothetical protein